MAVGNNSLKFIALAARRAWVDERIREMYDHALKSDWLCGNDMRKAVLMAEEWFVNGNTSSESE